MRFRLTSPVIGFSIPSSKTWLRDRVELLEAGASTKSIEYERKLQKVSKYHTMQLDELIVHLDLVEAEHKQRMAETEMRRTKKTPSLLPCAHNLKMPTLKKRRSMQLKRSCHSTLPQYKKRRQRQRRKSKS